MTDRDDDGSTSDFDALMRENPVFAKYMNTSVGTPPGFTRPPRSSSARYTDTGTRLMMEPPPIANAYWLPGGRLLAGEYPGDKDRRNAEQKIEKLLGAGVTSFIDLTTPDDGLEPYKPMLADRIAYGEIRYRPVLVPDLSVPTHGQMAELVGYIDDEIASGRIVYVHCWGGVGRTGTVVGCYLVHSGYTPRHALAVIADRWRMMEKLQRRATSPETPGQVEFVRKWRPPASISLAVGPYLRAPMLERFRGCLLGGAVGDALGAAVEFQSLTEITRNYGIEGIQKPGLAYDRVGAITDDTQMSMFTVEGILRATHRAIDRSSMGPPSWSGEHVPNIDVMHHAYLRWLRTQDGDSPKPPYLDEYPGWLFSVAELHSQRAPGNTCLSALRSGRGPGSIADPLNQSKGCGGVMRAAAAGLVDSADPFRYGSDVAAITHGHASGFFSAGALSLIIHEITRGTPLDLAVHIAVKRLKGEPGGEETARALSLAIERASERNPSAFVVESLGKGWTGEEALAIAVYCALAAEGDFKSGLRLAVNHSGDSDSTGAITGNILGAQLGVGAIPKRWLDALELRDAIETLAEDLFTGYRRTKAWYGRYPPN